MPFYDGFTIADPVGNNAFSFAERTVREIAVAPAVRGTVDDLSVGSAVAFCEVEDGVERRCVGLERFVRLTGAGPETTIFDNHNHAFAAWLDAQRRGVLPAGLPLVHVDQHKDTRRPDRILSAEEAADPAAVFRYTNFELNVGNFIVPAMERGVFSELVIIDSRADFFRTFAGPIVLDLDLDLFAPEMDYINRDLKLDKLREWIDQAQLITVATSPFFMDQRAAIELARTLFRSR